jgi:hypothetical protein
MLREEAEHGTRHQRAVGPSVSGTAGMGKPCMARFGGVLYHIFAALTQVIA